MKKIDLDETFNTFLNGRRFLDWSNRVTEKLIEESGQNEYVFYLNKILPLLKVKKVVFVKSAINGYVGIENDGFTVFLSERLKSNSKAISTNTPRRRLNQVKQIARYKFAHELSHLLFYDIHSTPPKHLLTLSHGSSELEYACNVLARCLILPRSLVVRFVNDFFERRKMSNCLSDYNLFYLPLSLMTQFDASWQNVLTRVFDDLELVYNCIFMEFAPYPFNDNEAVTTDSIYRLKWVKISNNLVKEGLFIPYPKNEEIPISGKGIIDKTIKGIISATKEVNQRGVVKTTLDRNSFKGFGNISRYLSDKYKQTEVSIPLFYLISKNSIFIAFSFDDIELTGE